MKCGIYFYKVGMFKVYAPIINACLKKGIEVVVYRPLLSNSSVENIKTKAQMLQDAKQMPFGNNFTILFFSSLQELESILINETPTFLITYETDGILIFQKFENYDKLFGPLGIPIFSVQWTFENFNTESITTHGNPKFLHTRKLFSCY